MNKIYLFVAIGAMIYGAYFYGVNVTDAKCHAKFANDNLQNFQEIQKQITQNKKENHEIVYKTAVRDIRSILRDKYTISE